MSASEPELALVTQHPSFGGGAEALALEFEAGARALGRRTCRLHSTYVPLLDSLNQVASAPRIGRRAREADEVWLVAAAASYGLGAVRSGRPYGVWVATTLEDEWAARRPFLPPSRRLAIAANAPLLRRLERTVVRSARRVLTTSAPTRQALSGATDVPLERIDVLPVPVDDERFHPEADEAWIGRLEHPTIVFLGRADDPRKNADLLLRAWPAIRRGAPAARLRLVGSRPAQPLPEGVVATGFLPSVAEELRRATLLVLPSRQEGFGIVVSEALASGVPVVATPCGGPEQILGASGGGVVLGGFTSDELASAVLELLDDERRLREMRAVGRAYVETELSRPVFARRLAGILEGVS